MPNFLAAAALPLIHPDLPAAPSVHDNTTAIFIAQILLLLVVGRLLGELLHRFGQPAVMGQLIGGIILGPSIFGAISPDYMNWIFPADAGQKKMLDAVGQLGVLMLLLLTGMETDVALIKRVKSTAIFSSLGGIIVPFSFGFLLGEMLPVSMLPHPEKRILTSLFLATALSISSVKIVAMVLVELDFFRRNVGQIMLASAIIDDTIGWTIIAVISGIAQSGNLELSGIVFSLAGTAIFLAAAFTIGRRIVNDLIRWTNDNFATEMPVITLIIAITLALALVTNAIGVHTVLGAFVAGIIIGRSPILTKHIEEQIRGLIVALFMPIFFAGAGLSIDLAVLRDLRLIELTIGLTAIATLGKLIGCYTGGRIGSLTHLESKALAIGMNARGSTEIIVATIGLSLQVLTNDLFTMIVIMAVTTTLITPPLLRSALSDIPPSGEEKERLEREMAEAKDFVPSIQRILIAVDTSPHGRLASRLAGFLAGTRKMLSTVIELDGAQPAAPPATPLAIAQTAADLAAGKADPHTEATGAESISAKTVGDRGADRKEILNTASEKGYDLLFVGTKDTARFKDSAIHQAIENFKGVSAVTIARGKHRVTRSAAQFNILVPVAGTEYSRKAAEIAIALAKGGGGLVTTLYIVNSAADERSWRRPEEYINAGRKFASDVAELGRREKVEVRSLIRRNRPVGPEILSRINRGGYDLVVLGVKPRTGPEFILGSNAAALVERSTCSVLLVLS